ncbi:MAG TPA: aspartate carbamoyltransferase regulatory subunit [Clostridiales bacterium]|nr:aspartate carbamoyltransferase regulatory subunit [Clostridiales bacterium]
MNIDSIKNGIVIDHITAGKSLEIYHLLGLENLDCPVALIKNVASKKMLKKDIIKIDNEYDINTEILGFVDPKATVNIIKGGKITEKKTLELPEKLKGILKCKNPRCITSCEQEIEHIFVLSDRQKGEYRCAYCETKVNRTSDYGRRIIENG